MSRRLKGAAPSGCDSGSVIGSGPFPRAIMHSEAIEPSLIVAKGLLNGDVFPRIISRCSLVLNGLYSQKPGEAANNPPTSTQTCE
jgi:hypothetical protein